MLINRGKFDACTSISFRVVKTDRQKSAYILNTTASLAESLSVTSELRVSVQPAKPASPIRLLCKELPKAYVFSVHTVKLSQLFVLLFDPHRTSHFKVLAMP